MAVFGILVGFLKKDFKFFTIKFEQIPAGGVSWAKGEFFPIFFRLSNSLSKIEFIKENFSLESERSMIYFKTQNLKLKNCC